MVWLEEVTSSLKRGEATFLLKEGVSIKELTLKDYLLENDIVVAEEYFRGYRGATEEDVSCQFIVIQSVHKV